MRVDAFDFDLPEHQIALTPAKPRDSARLLEVSTDGVFLDHKVHQLPDLLRSGDLLVLNQTRVIPAHLAGLRWRPAIDPLPVDLTLVEPDTDVPARWRALAKPGKRIKPSDKITFDGRDGAGLSCLVVEKSPDGLLTLEFDADPDALASFLNANGKPPLPPYIAGKRGYQDRDRQDYQTIYAAKDGSVAAPTAGLHFTERLFEALDKRGVAQAFVTLHVGMGTFLPVKADRVDDHRMHAEWGEITPAVANTINKTRADGGRVIAVGTTSLRILESAVSDAGLVEAFRGMTDIFITPGYRFRVVDALITNFHLPKSTLFMLVSALCGLDRMKAAYTHAVAKDYRFYSYGDGSLLWKAP